MALDWLISLSPTTKQGIPKGYLPAYYLFVMSSRELQWYRFGSSKFRRRRAALEVNRETLVRVFGAGVCQNLTSKKKVRNQGKLLKTLKIPCGRAQQDPTRDENKKSK
jgi:hypothetical protein